MIKTIKPNIAFIFFELFIFTSLIVAVSIYVNLIFIKQQQITIFSDHFDVWLSLIPGMLVKIVVLVSIGSIFIFIDLSVSVSEQGITYRKYILKKEFIPWPEITEYKSFWLLVPIVSIKSNSTNKSCKVTSNILKHKHFELVNKQH